jgi:hypothetical protein
MESVGSTAARRRSSAWFGFSLKVAISCENQGFSLLDFLGFPWILSSESRLINGLHEIFRREFFETPSRNRRRNGGPTIRQAKRTDCSWRQDTSISDFLQEIAAEAVPRTATTAG